MREALHWEKKNNNNVQCALCPHQCLLTPGERGICGVRENRGGTLFSLVYGLPCSMAIDPIEKKPLYHFLPGSRIFSIATVGCNLKCAWCQNWEISHPKEQTIIAPYGEVSAQEVINRCEENDCSLIAFTYTEPAIFYEYMLDIARLAKKKGIRTVMVSNGYIEDAPLQELIPYLDAANIDLKAFSEETYRKWTGARMRPVLNTIKRLREANVHVEITTLIVPEVNDGEKELEQLYEWVERDLGKDQVVHISKFFPYYQAKDKRPTPMTTLERAESIAKSHLRYVYLGNVGKENDTLCPSCARAAVKRVAGKIRITLRRGTCPCGENISGIWK